MIGRADIEGSKSNVATNAWLPQASYPWGNYSDTSRSTLRKKKTLERIDGPRFRGRRPHWRLRSSRLLPFCSTADFRPAWADLGTPALPFDRCAAPAKLPTRHCPRSRSRSLSHAWNAEAKRSAGWVKKRPERWYFTGDRHDQSRVGLPPILHLKRCLLTESD